MEGIAEGGALFFVLGQAVSLVGGSEDYQGDACYCEGGAYD